MNKKQIKSFKYAKAASVLSKVSSGYQERLNVNPYCDRDPFQYGFTETGKPFENYKMNFDVEMRELEKKIASRYADGRQWPKGSLTRRPERRLSHNAISCMTTRATNIGKRKRSNGRILS